MVPLFDKLISLYRLVTPDQDGEADVCVSNEAVLENLRYLLHVDRSPDITGLTIRSGDPDHLKVGDTIRLGFGLPRLGMGHLLPNVAELVKAGPTKEPEHYYLWQPPRSNDDPDVPAEIVRYREVLALVALLKEAAGYLDEATGALVFTQQGRFDVPVRYTLGDITVDVAERSARLRGLFVTSMHREQKLVMLAAAVQDATRAEIASSRFATLLIKLETITTEVDNSYKLFCANFSYEKIKDAIQDAQIEFTAKIHKTFSDIQNQLLAIPVATVVVATQMKETASYNAQFWINTGVLLGSVLFVLLFVLLVCNQWRTLDVLADEIKRRKKTLAEQYTAIDGMFSGTFKKLKRRVCQQRVTIAMSLIVVLIGAVAAVIVYCQLNPQLVRLVSSPR